MAGHFSVEGFGNFNLVLKLETCVACLERLDTGFQGTVMLLLDLINGLLLLQLRRRFSFGLVGF